MIYQPRLQPALSPELTALVDNAVRNLATAGVTMAEADQSFRAFFLRYPDILTAWSVEMVENHDTTD